MFEQEAPDPRSDTKTFIVRIKGNKNRSRSIRTSYHSIVARHFSIAQDKLVEKHHSQELSFPYQGSYRELQNLIFLWKKDYSNYPIDYDEILKEDEGDLYQKRPKKYNTSKSQPVIQKPYREPIEDQLPQVNLRPMTFDLYQPPASQKDEFQLFQQNNQQLRRQVLPRKLFNNKKKYGKYQNWMNLSDQPKKMPNSMDMSEKHHLFVQEFNQEGMTSFLLQPQWPQKISDSKQKSQRFQSRQEKKLQNYQKMIQIQQKKRFQSREQRQLQKMIQIQQNEKFQLQEMIQIQQNEIVIDEESDEQIFLSARQRSREKKNSTKSAMNISKSIDKPQSVNLCELNQTHYIKMCMQSDVIDKTQLISVILESQDRIINICRPGKWGKTTTLSMLRSYFQFPRNFTPLEHQQFLTWIFEGGYFPNTQHKPQAFRKPSKLSRHPFYSQYYESFKGIYTVLSLAMKDASIVPMIEQEQFTKTVMYSLTNLVYNLYKKEYSYLNGQHKAAKEMKHETVKLETYVDNLSPIDYQEVCCSLLRLVRLLRLFHSRPIILLIDDYDYFIMKCRSQQSRKRTVSLLQQLITPLIHSQAIKLVIITSVFDCHIGDFCCIKPQRMMDFFGVNETQLKILIKQIENMCEISNRSQKKIIFKENKSLLCKQESINTQMLFKFMERWLKGYPAYEKPKYDTKSQAFINKEILTFNIHSVLQYLWKVVNNIKNARLNLHDNPQYNLQCIQIPLPDLQLKNNIERFGSDIEATVTDMLNQYELQIVLYVCSEKYLSRLCKFASIDIFSLSYLQYWQETQNKDNKAIKLVSFLVHTGILSMETLIQQKRIKKVRYSCLQAKIWYWGLLKKYLSHNVNQGGKIIQQLSNIIERCDSLADVMLRYLNELIPILLDVSVLDSHAFEVFIELLMLMMSRADLQPVFVDECLSFTCSSQLGIRMLYSQATHSVMMYVWKIVDADNQKTSVTETDILAQFFMKINIDNLYRYFNTEITFHATVSLISVTSALNISTTEIVISNQQQLDFLVAIYISKN